MNCIIVLFILLFLELIMTIQFVTSFTLTSKTRSGRRRNDIGNIIPDEFIVVLKPKETGDDSLDGYSMNDMAQALVSNFSVKIKSQVSIGTLNMITVHGSEAHMDKIRLSPDIRYVEPNKRLFGYRIESRASDNASDCSVQDAYELWNLDRIDQRSAWTRDGDNEYHFGDTDNGDGVYVYVADSGIDIKQAEFEGRAIWGYTADDLGDDIDIDGHGTHVAGIIGGATYGVAKKVTLIAVKVLGGYDGTGSVAGMIDGFQWIINHHHANGRPKKVINMSLGLDERSESLDEAVENMIELGFAVVVAAGNDYTDACDSSPAGVSGAITVGATDEYDRLTYFSNWGTCVDLFAPGSSILSAHPDGEILYSGTSQATPHVTGVIARYLATLDDTKTSPSDITKWLLDMTTKDAIEYETDYERNSPNRLLYINCYSGKWDYMKDDNYNNNNNNNDNNDSSASIVKLDKQLKILTIIFLTNLMYQ